MEDEDDSCGHSLGQRLMVSHLQQGKIRLANKKNFLTEGGLSIGINYSKLVKISICGNFQVQVRRVLDWNALIGDAPVLSKWPHAVPLYCSVIRVGGVETDYL